MCTGWIGQVNFLFAVIFLAPFSCTSFRLLIAATFYFATTVVIIATITNGTIYIYIIAELKEKSKILILWLLGLSTKKR